MPFLYKDYTDLILKTYAERRDAGNLPRLLMRPTRANIKQECLNAYTERLENGEKVEVNTLRAFFGVLTEGKEFDDLINECPLDRFRPLQSLMNGRIQNPDEITVELLAWLTNFKPRPFSNAQQVLRETVVDGTAIPITDGSQIPDETEETKMKAAFTVTNTGEPEDQMENGREKIPKTGNEKTKNLPRNPGLKIAVAICLTTIIFFGGMYIIRQYEISKGTVFGNANTACMYWADDHYEKIPCNEERKGRLILPLDEEKMKNFRKITREDTITEWSIGKIYYLKDNRVLEYYTTGGNHPVDITRTLKVLSRHMFDTYLLKKEASVKDSLGESNRKP